MHLSLTSHPAVEGWANLAATRCSSSPHTRALHKQRAPRDARRQNSACYVSHSSCNRDLANQPALFSFPVITHECLEFRTSPHVSDDGSTWGPRNTSEREVFCSEPEYWDRTLISWPSVISRLLFIPSIQLFSQGFSWQS